MKAIVLSLVLIACASTQTATPTKEEAASAYAGQQLACVEQAKTLEESRACRAKVREQWGVTDGGAR